MNIALWSDRPGRPGATLRLVLGERVISPRLSIKDARRLRDKLTLMLDAHDAARSADTDALVARSDMDALDALTRALDAPARPSYGPMHKPDLDDYSGFDR